MEFTEFADLQSLKQNIIPQNMLYHYEENFLINQPSAQFNSILQEIQQINHSRSISASLIDMEDNPYQSNFMLDGLQDEKQQINQQFLFTPSKIRINQSRRSTIFTSAHSKDDKSTIYTSAQLYEHSSSIQVFYFGQRIYKHIQFNKNTTIQMLINKALQVYIRDYSLDQTNVISTEPKNYEMRFIKEQGSYLPDYSVEAIARDRVLADALFQVLVLVKTIKDHKNSMANSYRQIQNTKINAQGHVKINIFNEANMHVKTLILSKNQTLQKAINFLQAQLRENIVLFQNLQTDMFLPSDIDIGNLGTYKLYVKKKRYLDEPQKQKSPLKIISTIPKNLTNPILPPIGITEASRYEQFQVIKINSRGIEQPRVIGFDQTKYYNYDTSVRKKNKQVSFFSTFVGNNIFTGTKKPERLISDIIKVNSKQGLYLQIVLPQKSILFKVDNQAKKLKILRKVEFLVDYNKKNKI